jgi:hypothetical protein
MQKSDRSDRSKVKTRRFGSIDIDSSKPQHEEAIRKFVADDQEAVKLVRALLGALA